MPYGGTVRVACSTHTAVVDIQFTIQDPTSPSCCIETELGPNLATLLLHKILSCTLWSVLVYSSRHVIKSSSEFSSLQSFTIIPRLTLQHSPDFTRLFLAGFRIHRRIHPPRFSTSVYMWGILSVGKNDTIYIYMQSITDPAHGNKLHTALEANVSTLKEIMGPKLPLNKTTSKFLQPSLC